MNDFAGEKNTSAHLFSRVPLQTNMHGLIGAQINHTEGISNTPGELWAASIKLNELTVRTAVRRTQGNLNCL